MSHTAAKKTRNRLYCKLEDGTFKCNVCGKITEKQNTMSTHVTTKHTTRREHECSECGETFVQSSALESHMRKHEEPTKYECGIDGCKVECAAASNMCVHVMRAHFVELCAENTVIIQNEDEPKKYGCKSCEKTFNSQTALLYHLYSCIGPGSD